MWEDVRGGHREAWGHVEKSQSEIESSKAAGEVKRAVELQEAFFVHQGLKRLEGCNHMKRRRLERSGACWEAVGIMHMDFILHLNCTSFSASAETIS